MSGIVPTSKLMALECRLNALVVRWHSTTTQQHSLMIVCGLVVLVTYIPYMPMAKMVRLVLAGKSIDVAALGVSLERCFQLILRELFKCQPYKGYISLVDEERESKYVERAEFERRMGRIKN